MASVFSKHIKYLRQVPSFRYALVLMLIVNSTMLCAVSEAGDECCDDQVYEYMQESDAHTDCCALCVTCCVRYAPQHATFENSLFTLNIISIANTGHQITGLPLSIWRPPRV